MIDLVERMPLPLATTTMIQEQLALALNRQASKVNDPERTILRERAERVLVDYGGWNDSSIARIEFAKQTYARLYFLYNICKELSCFSVLMVFPNSFDWCFRQHL
jgi:hypothetical protein